MLTRQSLSTLPHVPLTLTQVRKNLLVGAVNALWESIFGLYRLKQHAYFVASLMALLAIGQMVYLPFHWKLYQRLRRGETVLMAVAKPVQVSWIWSAIVAVLLTVIVGAETFMCWAILQAGRTTWIVWMIMAVVNILLWGFVIYVWGRALADRNQVVRGILPNDERQEGVWPPPPKVLNDEKEQE